MNQICTHVPAQPAQFPPDAPPAELLDAPASAEPDDAGDDDTGADLLPDAPDNLEPHVALPSLDAQLAELQRRRTSAAIKEIRSGVGPTVARRMREARELCGLTQLEAAPLVGYLKSTQLSLIELGHRIAPLWLLVRASEVYSVSLDWLCGLTDECERDPAGRLARHISNAVSAQLEAVRDSTVAVSMAYVQSLAPLVPFSERIEFAARNLKARAEVVRENPEWPDLRGGAGFEAALTQLLADVSALVVETRRRVNSANLTCGDAAAAARSAPGGQQVADRLERLPSPFASRGKLAA
ncbi:hypothetical protein IP84_00750 [beta proteobacterium AAP99]|nr:hypothetical protein IP84_00750 [beta proteobacterium AAP99]